MKVKIFNRGKGWYVPAQNYKDDTDKCYINFHFAKCEEPEYHDNGRGFSCIDIVIDEGKFNSYKGQAGITVFKYHLTDEEQNDEFNRSLDGTKYADEFDPKVKIEEKELPFY